MAWAALHLAIDVRGGRHQQGGVLLEPAPLRGVLWLADLLVSGIGVEALFACGIGSWRLVRS